MTEISIPSWRPDVFAKRRNNLEARARAAAAIRAFFASRDYFEVDPPALQHSPCMEPHLKAFATTFEDGATPRKLYLHTSPEFAMKKLLVGGMERIFHLAHVWRNEIMGPLHHPEFTMLEWYSTGLPLQGMMDETEGLMRAAAKAVGADTLRYKDVVTPIDDTPWRRMTVAEAFDHFTGIDVFATIDDRLRPDPALLTQKAKEIGIEVSADDSWDDVFFKIFLERIEPKLGIEAPVFIYEYPVHMAALARPNVDNPAVCDRFEIYACGLELCNAFGELNDGTEQRRRFHADVAERKRLYGIDYPVDEDFLAAIDHGLPEASGNALGFDRLVMLLVGADHIDEVLWLPVIAP